MGDWYLGGNVATFNWYTRFPGAIAGAPFLIVPPTHPPSGALRAPLTNRVKVTLCKSRFGLWLSQGRGFGFLSMSRNWYTERALDHAVSALKYHPLKIRVRVTYYRVTLCQSRLRSSSIHWGHISKYKFLRFFLGRGIGIRAGALYSGCFWAEIPPTHPLRGPCGPSQGQG